MNDQKSHIKRMVKVLFISNEAYQQALDAACEDSHYRGKSFVERINRPSYNKPLI